MWCQRASGKRVAIDSGSGTKGDQGRGELPTDGAQADDGPPGEPCCSLSPHKQVQEQLARVEQPLRGRLQRPTDVHSSGHVRASFSRRPWRDRESRSATADPRGAQGPPGDPFSLDFMLHYKPVPWQSSREGLFDNLGVPVRSRVPHI